MPTLIAPAKRRPSRKAAAGARPSGPSFKPSDFIASHPVFRFDEFLEAHTASGASPQTTAAVLRYHLKTGRILNLRRGLYAHPGALDPWVLGSRLASDAVIAYDGALSFHELGPVEYSLSFLTNQRASPFAYDEIAYRPVRDPKALKGSLRGGHINDVHRCGQSFRVTSVERTLVDLLDRLDLGHGSRQLWDSFVAVRAISPDDMVDYALRLKSRITAARVGFFLEQLGARPSVLIELQRASPKSPAYFEPGHRASGERYYSRWRLVVSRKLRTHIEAGVRVNPWRDPVEDE